MRWMFPIYFQLPDMTGKKKNGQAKVWFREQNCRSYYQQDLWEIQPLAGLFLTLTDCEQTDPNSAQLNLQIQQNYIPAG